MKQDKIINVLKTLSNDTRYNIIKELKHASIKGMQPTQLSEQLQINMTALSFHLSKLENADLVFQKRKGVNIYYTLNYPTLAALQRCSLF